MLTNTTNAFQKRACTPVPVGAVIPRMYLPACRRSLSIQRLALIPGSNGLCFRACHIQGSAPRLLRADTRTSCVSISECTIAICRRGPQCVDSMISVTDSRNHGLHGVTRMVRSPLSMFGLGMCCAVFAASMVGGSLWLATTFITSSLARQTTAPATPAHAVLALAATFMKTRSATAPTVAPPIAARTVKN
jgi:hypothetical protein